MSCGCFGADGAESSAAHPAPLTARQETIPTQRQSRSSRSVRRCISLVIDLSPITTTLLPCALHADINGARQPRRVLACCASTRSAFGKAPVGHVAHLCEQFQITAKTVTGGKVQQIVAPVSGRIGVVH